MGQDAWAEAPNNHKNHVMKTAKSFHGCKSVGLCEQFNRERKGYFGYFG
jgi:hypothetical protein